MVPPEGELFAAQQRTSDHVFCPGGHYRGVILRPGWGGDGREAFVRGAASRALGRWSQESRYL